MSTFWKGIEKVRGWASVPEVWRQHMGDEDFERVQNSFLIPTGRQAIWFPSPDVCECKMDVVIHAPDHIVGVSECGACDNIALAAADIVMMELSWKKLGRAIATALQCEPKDVDIGVFGTRQIAAFGGSSMPVILVIQLDRHEFADVLRRIVLQIGKNFVLLSPTSRFIDANTNGLLERSNAGFFALETFMSVHANGMLRSTKTAGELFSRFVPEDTAKPVQQTEATRIFQLVAKLKSESANQKASPFDVFNFLVLEKLTKAKTAQKCDCAASLITLRVKELERIFGMSIEQLRSYASDVREMELSVKGDRLAKRKEGAVSRGDFDETTDRDENDDSDDEDKDDDP